jgi:hypothetical protein
MFNFTVAICWRREVLSWFDGHVIHECTVFLLCFMFITINLFIIILPRTLCRCIISNFQLLKLFLLA